MKPSLTRGQRIQLRIDRLSVGGRGVGRHGNIVVFVHNTAPEETAEVEVTHVKKNFAEGKLIRVLEPSPYRVEAPRPVAEVCGGCTWQHVHYEEQLKQKREIVAQSLTKFSGYNVSEKSLVQAVIPSPSAFRYRNRIQLHYSNQRIGFFKRGSHQIVDIEDCPITEEQLAAEIPRLRESLEGRPPCRVEIYISQSGEVVNTSGTQLSEDEDDTGAGPAFSQVNTAQNLQLVQAVIEAFKLEVTRGQSPSVFYDLYAGNGNFTFPLAESFLEARVCSVELNSTNVRLAQERASNEFKGRDIRVIKMDVQKFLDQEAIPKNSFVLLDPPRTGCAPEVISTLARKRPEVIAYVSCHPVTLARDLKPLNEAGYQLLHVQPFDMFPQTDHVETLVLLRLVPTTIRSAN